MIGEIWILPNFLGDKILGHLEKQATGVYSDRQAGYKAGVEAFDTVMKTSPTVYNVDLLGKDMNKKENILACINGQQPYEDIKVMLYYLTDKVETGEYVRYKDEIFISDKLDMSTVGYNKRKIQQCNNTLKFRDGVSGKVYEFPCLIQDKTSVYADGLAITQQNIIADDMIMITIPNNKHIASIPSYGYRLIFNNSVAYKTTRKDMLTNEDVITFRCIAELINKDKDDLDNNLAHQSEVVEISSDEEVSDISIELSGYNIIRQGQTLSYDVNVIGAENKEYTVKCFDGDIECTDIEVLDKSDTGFKIKSNTIDRNINLVVELVENGAKDNLIIECKGRWG